MHWYALSKTTGVATLCASEQDARRAVKAYDRRYPRAAPHIATQLVSVDAQELIEACVPGGSICDPQNVADAIREYMRSNDQVRTDMHTEAEIDRLHTALVAITNVPVGTVLTAHQMRMIAKNAIATPREALYEAACAMDNQDVPLEDWPVKLIAALGRAGFAVVPVELPHDVLGRAVIAGVAETGNPKHAWDFLIAATRAA